MGIIIWLEMLGFKFHSVPMISIYYYNDTHKYMLTFMYKVHKRLISRGFLLDRYVSSYFIVKTSRRNCEKLSYPTLGAILSTFFKFTLPRHLIRLLGHQRPQVVVVQQFEQRPLIGGVVDQHLA